MDKRRREAAVKIKDMEERTGIARANIRFYESKGLLWTFYISPEGGWLWGG